MLGEWGNEHLASGVLVARLFRCLTLSHVSGWGCHCHKINHFQNSRTLSLLFPSSEISDGKTRIGRARSLFPSTFWEETIHLEKMVLNTWLAAHFHIPKMIGICFTHFIQESSSHEVERGTDIREIKYGIRIKQNPFEESLLRSWEMPQLCLVSCPSTKSGTD